ncbi:MAG: zinc ribbon domain-containing protein [Firmicutes bacterium]|nr:zinc ribbon domain-containing protein [Bacillota bacterium]
MADFFTRVRRNINKGISTVSEKSAVFLETAKIKGQIGKLEDQRNELLQALGHYVYQNFAAEALDEKFIAEKCDEITALEQAIAAKTEELEAITKAEKAEPEAEEQVAKCECGAEIQPEAKFCSNCGTQLRE